MEEAIIVHFQYGSTNLARLFALEDQIEDALAAASAGELDGHEIAVDGSDGFLYVYGPDADRLFEIMLPILWSSDFMDGAEITRRYGPAAEDTRRVVETLNKAAIS